MGLTPDALREVDVEATPRGLTFSVRWWQLSSLLMTGAAAIAILYRQSEVIAYQLDSLTSVVHRLNQTITGDQTDQPSILERIGKLETEESVGREMDAANTVRIEVHARRIESIESYLRDGGAHREGVNEKDHR